MRAQPLEAVAGAGQLVGEAHVLQLAHRAGGEPVAAGLLAGVVLALDHDHVVAGAGQPVGARRARGPATDHQHVAAAGGNRGRVVHSEQSSGGGGAGCATGERGGAAVAVSGAIVEFGWAAPGVWARSGRSGPGVVPAWRVAAGWRGGVGANRPVWARRGPRFVAPGGRAGRCERDPADTGARSRASEPAGRANWLSGAGSLTSRRGAVPADRAVARPGGAVRRRLGVHARGAWAQSGPTGAKEGPYESGIAPRYQPAARSRSASTWSR